MINKNYITKSIIGITSIATILAALALPALAQTTATIKTSITLNTLKIANTLPQIISKSDTAITVRITALNNLSTRIGAMKNVSDSEKTNISTEVQTQISALTSLKAKIDADTDVTTARADAKTITGNYRIYALVLPQGYILASADRISTIVGLMTSMQAELQVRITALQATGKDVTSLQTAMTDITAKTTDATSQGQTAQTAVASLAPDQGNVTVAASNKTALVGARANLKTASQDLQAARKDITTILQGLKVPKTSASASASVSATSTSQ